MAEFEVGMEKLATVSLDHPKGELPFNGSPDLRLLTLLCRVRVRTPHELHLRHESAQASSPNRKAFRTKGLDHVLMRHAFFEVQLLDSGPEVLSRNGPCTTDKSPCPEPSLDRCGRYLRTIVLLQGPGNDRRRVSAPEQTLDVIAKPVDDLVSHHDVSYKLGMSGSGSFR